MVRVMEKRKFHWEWAAYTDNLCYGRQLIVRDRNKAYVERTAWNAHKGAYVIERERVYDSI